MLPGYCHAKDDVGTRDGANIPVSGIKGSSSMWKTQTPQHQHHQMMYQIIHDIVHSRAHMLLIKCITFCCIFFAIANKEMPGTHLKIAQMPVVGKCHYPTL